MENFEIDILKDYSCMGTDCPYTCCRGWQIPVDDNTMEHYRALPGFKGKLYRLGIIRREPARIRKFPLSCPFLTRARLCRHQAEGKMQLMPLVCKNYPRRIMDFGKYKEITLELSCPMAAGLFLDNPGKRAFVYSKTPLESLWVIVNDDPEFLEFLKTQREKIIDCIWKDEPIYDIWARLYDYVYEQHESIARDRLSEAKHINIPAKASLKNTGKRYAFFPIVTIDHMLIEHIDHGAMVFRVPRFYNLIYKYIKTFSRKTLAEADIFFNEMLEEMMEVQSHLALKYRSYFSYTIQQEYMHSYETYSIIREFLFCVLYTQLLMMFDLLEYLRKGIISRKRETEILYLAEHNIRHNPYLRRQLYSVIREEFF